jgi:hypothetical protein
VVWVNSAPDPSDPGPIGLSVFISGVSVLVSYGFGFVAPFMYQGDFNKGIQQGILYEP